jgi:hypothetical protein
MSIARIQHRSQPPPEVLSAYGQSFTAIAAVCVQRSHIALRFVVRAIANGRVEFSVWDYDPFITI